MPSLSFFTQWQLHGLVPVVFLAKIFSSGFPCFLPWSWENHPPPTHTESTYDLVLMGGPWSHYCISGTWYPPHIYDHLQQSVVTWSRLTMFLPKTSESLNDHGDLLNDHCQKSHEIGWLCDDSLYDYHDIIIIMGRFYYSHKLRTICIESQICSLKKLVWFNEIVINFDWQIFYVLLPRKLHKPTWNFYFSNNLADLQLLIICTILITRRLLLLTESSA